MANPEHLAILKQGVEVWNRWRSEDTTHPDLSEIDLRSVCLKGANLGSTNLRNSNMAWSQLIAVDLDRADLTDSDLRWADLRGVSFEGARLCNCLLGGTQIMWSSLKDADMTGSLLKHTAFVNVNLFGTRGLESCEYLGPNQIDRLSLQQSGKLPLAFLRGLGMSNWEIDLVDLYDQGLSKSTLNDILYRVSISRGSDSIQFWSCFISYTTKNHDFPDCLHADLQNNGVRCWFAPEHLKIGDSFRQRIDESIRIHDKLLLILSRDSVNSQWVQDEVETALERERREKRLVLFPIRIDHAVMDTNEAWAASIRRTRHIGDFSNWKNHDSYQRAFQRLLRDLKAEKRESG